MFPYCWKLINLRSTSLSPSISASEKNTPGNSLQKFSTHYHFGNFDNFSGQSHILENEASSECGWISNTTSLCMGGMFPSFDYSYETLINYFEWFFSDHSLSLLQWWRDSYYVPKWMHFFKPNSIWWYFIIFCICGGESHWIA